MIERTGAGGFSEGKAIRAGPAPLKATGWNLELTLVWQTTGTWVSVSDLSVGAN